jgi:ABC-2 type transport system ATP-binding protein
VAVMDHGRLLALDTPAALKRSLGADTVVRVSADGDLEGLARHLGGAEGATRVDVGEDGAVRVYLRGAAGALPRVMAAADSGRFPLTDLSITEPTLETVFISLTGRDLRE